MSDAFYLCVSTPSAITYVYCESWEKLLEEIRTRRKRRYKPIMRRFKAIPFSDSEGLSYERFCAARNHAWKTMLASDEELLKDRTDAIALVHKLGSVSDV